MNAPDQPALGSIDLTEVIADLKARCDSWPSRKAELKRAYGSIEAAVQGIWSDSEMRLEIESELKASEELRQRLDGLREAEVHQMASELADVTSWRAKANRGPRAFASDVDSFLRQCKRTLKLACGIQPHRAADDERSELIARIKIGKPEASFGEVALAYRRQTRKPMDAKNAERIYKRAAFHEFFQPKRTLAALTRLEQFRNQTTKA
jgi:hypothetical protein